MYIKLEKLYNNTTMNKCVICKKEWCPKCKWMPCKLERLRTKGKK